MVVMQVSAALSLGPKGERPTLVHQKCGRADILSTNARPFAQLPRLTIQIKTPYFWHYSIRRGQVSILGVPAVLEQKTTICCKLLYLLTSKRRVSPTYSRERTHVEGMEENPFYGLNSTLSVGNIRGLLPRYAWTKTFVFLLTLDRESTDRCFLYACYGNPKMLNQSSIWFSQLLCFGV